jgi:hypothetical protein
MNLSTAAITFRVLGIVIGALSVVSLVQRFLDVGLAGVLADCVDFYREVSTVVLGAPARLFGWSPPRPLVDVWALSFVGAGGYVRTPGIEKSRGLGFLNLDPDAIAWKIGVLLIFGFSGIDIAILMSAVSPLTYVDSFHEEPKDLMQGAGKNIFWIFAAAVAFFAFNAYGPGG